MPEHDETKAAGVSTDVDTTESLPHRDEEVKMEVSTTVDTEPDTFPRAYVEQLRAEAAGYRTRAGRADELQRRLVETTIRSAAAAHLADPGDLLVFGDGADLLDDDGYPDADRIETAARTLAQARPHLAPRRPSGDIGQGATAPPGDVDLAGILRARAR